jgi:hypothetical protein
MERFATAVPAHEISDADLGALAGGVILYGNGVGNDAPITDPVDSNDPAEIAG